MSTCSHQQNMQSLPSFWAPKTNLFLIFQLQPYSFTALSDQAEKLHCTIKWKCPRFGLLHVMLTLYVCTWGHSRFKPQTWHFSFTNSSQDWIHVGLNQTPSDLLISFFHRKNRLSNKSFESTINHKGKWLGDFYNFWIEQRQIDQIGTWTGNLQINMPNCVTKQVIVSYTAQNDTAYWPQLVVHKAWVMELHCTYLNAGMVLAVSFFITWFKFPSNLSLWGELLGLNCYFWSTNAPEIIFHNNDAINAICSIV